MTHLYLIRHGEATSQVQNILRDDGLTSRGVRQVERLRDRLAATGEIAADVLIASTLPRARQTAEIIAPALNLPIIFDDDVQELRLGEAEGLSMDEVVKKFGKSDFEKDPFRPVAPGGEYWGQFVLRVATALDRIVHRFEGQTIVVICHGGVIDGSFFYFFNMGTAVFHRTHFYTTNTSITYWRQETFENSRSYWRLVRYNDNFHLRDFDAVERIPWSALKLPEKHMPSSTTPPQVEQ